MSMQEDIIFPLNYTFNTENLYYQPLKANACVKKFVQPRVDSQANEFKFKYVPEVQFAKIVKKVKDQKSRQQEEKEWKKYLSKQELQDVKLFGDIKDKESDVFPSNDKFAAIGSEVYEETTEQQNEVEVIPTAVSTPGHKNTVKGKYAPEIQIAKIAKQVKDAECRLREERERKKYLPEKELSDVKAIVHKHLKRSNIFHSDIKYSGTEKECPGDLALNLRGKETDLAVAPSNNNAVKGKDESIHENSTCISVQSTGHEAVLSKTLSKYSVAPDCECITLEPHLGCEANNDKIEIIPNCHDFYSYSQSQLNHLSDTESLKQICTSKESIHVFRLETLCKRILGTLGDIHNLVKHIPTPDGVEDLRRRQQRAAEFSSRFCRNYLYQLQRQINDIRKQMKCVPDNDNQHPYHLILCQKLVTAHQNAHQALQAYLHHMPCSVKRGVPDKLQELLQFVKDLGDLCLELGITNEKESGNIRDEIGKMSANLLLQIQCKENDKSDIGSIVSCASLSKKIRKVTRKGLSNERYSMYSSNVILKPKCTRLKKVGKSSNVSAKKKKEFSNIKGDKKEISMKNGQKLHQNSGVFSNFSSKTDCIESLPTQNHQINSECFLSSMHKIEADIEKLQENISKLKENPSSHQDYKEILGKLYNYLTDLKYQKIATVPYQECIKNINKPNKQKVKFTTSFPKNVKLICLPLEENAEINLEHSSTLHELQHLKTSGGDVKEYTKFTENSSFATPQDLDNSHLLNSNEINVDNVDGKLPSKQTHDSETKNKIEQCDKETFNLPPNWEPKHVGNFCEWKNGEFITINDVKLPDFKKSPENDSVIQSDLGRKHPNTPESKSSTFPSTNYVHSKQEKQSNIKEQKNPCIQLEVSNFEVASALRYKKVFNNFVSTKSLYNESRKPWFMVARLANHLVDNVLNVVLNDIGIHSITSELFELEFQ